MKAPSSFALRFVVFFIAVIPVWFFFGCASSSGGAVQKRSPSLLVKYPPETVYNGEPQPISFSYSGGDIPEIIYYPSPEALEQGVGGSFSAPSQAGTYYVLLRSLFEEVHAEYNILKLPVKIEAEEIQDAIYNGNPRRILATAEPHVQLFVSYYPGRKIMEDAIKTVEANSRRQNSSLPSASPSMEIHGLNREETAPRNSGTYYVWVYYPGDKNHQTASAFVEFTIHPQR